MSLTAESQLRVRFITKYTEYTISDAPFALPAKLGRAGLSEVVNHLRDAKEHQPFDFSVRGKLIRSPLYKFCEAHQISLEDTVIIEYFPAISFSSDSQSTELPAWIGSIDAKYENIGFAGCYDGKLQIFNPSDLTVQLDLQAHTEPIRSVYAWKEEDHNESRYNIATASKDHHAKVWIYDTSTGKANLKADLIGHANSVEAVTFARNTQQPDDSLILSGDWSGNVFAWKLSSHNIEDSQAKKKRKGNTEEITVIAPTKPLFTMKAHSQSISSILHDASTQRIYTSSWDHSWKLWDLEKQDVISTINTSRVITSLARKPQVTNILATSHPDGRVRVWDNRESSGQAASSTFGKDFIWISQVQWLPESENHFVTSDYSGAVTIWDNRSSISLGKTEAHNGKALSLHWSKGTDSEYSVISGGSDCILRKVSLQK